MIGILYFSSTGNSLYIAQKIQDQMGGQIKYIPNYNGNGSEFEKIILVTPIYSFGMPTFVYDIIPRLIKQQNLLLFKITVVWSAVRITIYINMPRKTN